MHARRVRRHVQMANRQALHVLVEPGARQQGSGGRLLSSKTRRSANRVAALFRIAAVTSARPGRRSAPSVGPSPPEGTESAAGLRRQGVVQR